MKPMIYERLESMLTSTIHNAVASPEFIEDFRQFMSINGADPATALLKALECRGGRYPGERLSTGDTKIVWGYREHRDLALATIDSLIETAIRQSDEECPPMPKPRFPRIGRWISNLFFWIGMECFALGVLVCDVCLRIAGGIANRSRLLSRKAYVLSDVYVDSGAPYVDTGGISAGNVSVFSLRLVLDYFEQLHDPHSEPRLESTSTVSLNLEANNE